MNVIPSPLHMLERARSAFDMKTIERALNFTRPGGFVPQDFDVDSHTGFFPPQPLPKLPATFSVWEEALTKAQGILYLQENQTEEALEMRPQGECWRDAVRSWPVLGFAFLRALHSQNVQQCPPPHSPLYCSTPGRSVTRTWHRARSDLRRHGRSQNIFSGTETESAFYIVSAEVELKGVEMLQIIESFMNLPNVTEYTSVVKIARDLVELTKIVKELTDIFASIRDRINPETFYWMCRPWWVGSQAKGPQPGWIYEGVPNSASLDLAGPSAGQSSVMHALDIFLDVDHKLAHHRQPTPSEANKKADLGFMERMRRYMPGKHRDYLARVGAVPRTVREVARTMPSLQEPYNEVVAALKHLRDMHIRIACLYVVNQATKIPPAVSGVAASDVKKAEDGHARGTGGNQTTILLKAGRDATQRAMLMDG